MDNSVQPPKPSYIASALFFNSYPILIFVVVLEIISLSQYIGRL